MSLHHWQASRRAEPRKIGFCCSCASASYNIPCCTARGKRDMHMVSVDTTDEGEG